MTKAPTVSREEVHRRRLVAARLQEIEANPLSPDQIAMFEMFEREGWSPERRRAYILTRARPLAAE
jgi:hypothetical protein